MTDNCNSVLLIYTGGTIGMIENTQTGGLEPFNFDHLTHNMSELSRLNFNIQTYLFNPPLDSSEISPDKWKEMVHVIEENFNSFDGFVILHGTDTMAYTASALSFMFSNLTKPVILTGSQLPIGKLRTDGKENLITALEIAASKDDEGLPIVPEVCIYFQNILLRGNRTTKVNAENFSAFSSPNYKVLAETGVDIKYDYDGILKPNQELPTRFSYNLDNHVVVLRLFPGITRETVSAILSIPSLKGVVLETYGSGNALLDDWFVEELEYADNHNLVIENITQCLYGSVVMHRYETGQNLEKHGVVSGYDMTTEAALAKMMFLFGMGYLPNEVGKLMPKSLRGELTNR